MISEMDELKQVKSNLEQLHNEAPHIYAKLEYIASLTRQLSIHYKYLGLLMFSNDAELVQNNRPTLIRESVLALYEQEVEKVKAEQNFILFKNMMLNLHNVD
ncbi:hypothetical protein BU600_05545, partial [Staphylococcus arlettae]